MYKLVAVDLDGTLLDSYGHISEKSKKTIKKAKENGIEVIMTSGRNPMSVKNLANEANTSKYAICGNGSIIYDLENEEIIYSKFIDKRIVLELIKICEENSVYYNITTQNAVIAKSLNYNVLVYHQDNANKPDNKKTNICLNQDIYNYVKNRDENDYLKINISDDNNIIFNSIIKKLRKIKNIDVLDVEHMSRKIIKVGTEESKVEFYYTEITGKNVNKWTALLYLMDKLNVNAEEVMTIGDNVNDIEMIENAGLGVAMENAAPYIKEKADAVTTNNNEDGVAVAIEKYILDANNCE